MPAILGMGACQSRGGTLPDSAENADRLAIVEIRYLTAPGQPVRQRSDLSNIMLQL
jgi:hypothetical protein